MKLLIQQKIQAGFAVALVFLLLTGGSAWWSARRNVETYGAAAHTHEGIERVNDLLADLLDMQAGVRGFAISGQEPFLQPYQDGIATVGRTVAEVKRLTQDNPEQLRRVAAIEPLIQERISFSNKVINLRRSGDTAGALEIIASGQGKGTMDEIRRLIAELMDNENTLLQQRTDEAQALSSTTIAIVAVGSLLS